MSTPRIILLGGGADVLIRVTQLLPYSCPISVLPADHQLSTAELDPAPQLVLVVQERNDQLAMKALRTMQKKLPRTPVLFIAENPSREAIIQAFRLGAKDYLIYPFGAEDFLRVFNQYVFKNGHAKPNSLMNKIKSWGKRQFERTPTPYNHTREPLILNTQSGEFLIYDPFQKREDNSDRFDLFVRFFGKFSIFRRGRPQDPLSGDKANALLGFLLYHHKAPIHREKLLSRFWGYHNPSSARNSLNVAVHHLRRYLKKIFPDTDFLQYREERYSIEPPTPIITDVDLFHQYWQEGRSLENEYGLEEAVPSYQKAASYYRGDFLEGIHYDEWCETERDNLQENYLLILDRLGTCFFQKEAYSFAVKVYREMLAKDACMEEAQRKLILSYYRLGFRDKAIKQYYKCVKVLKKELKIDPSATTKELFQLINREKEVRWTFL